MKKLIFLFILGLFLSNCNRLRDNISVSQVKWVYMEIEKINSKDTTYYFYFGRMNQRILSRIDSEDNYNNLFMLTDIRYVDDNDNVVEYEDESEIGTMFFRTQDIIYIEVLKKDPILIYNNTEPDSLNIN